VCVCVCVCVCATGVQYPGPHAPPLESCPHYICVYVVCEIKSPYFYLSWPCNLSVSASWVTGIQECTSIPGLYNDFLKEQFLHLLLSSIFWLEFCRIQTIFIKFKAIISQINLEYLLRKPININKTNNKMTPYTIPTEKWANARYKFILYQTFSSLRCIFWKTQFRSSKWISESSFSLENEKYWLHLCWSKYR
jgi:hypothetical protein